jgi:hypothetical protein
MAFTRSMYDQCALKQNDADSGSPFSMITDTEVLNKRCFYNSPAFLHSPSNSIPSGIVDLESELRSYNRPLGKCDVNRYTPKPQCESCDNCGTESKCDCLHCLTTTVEDCSGIDLESIHTRLNRAKTSIPSTQDRFEELAMNVQEESKIPSNAIAGINSRLEMKDSYDASKIDARLGRRSFL